MPFRIYEFPQGIEDFLGEMDFKMAGTSKGITAVQADVKIPGLPVKVVMETITQGVHAKNQILKTMHQSIQKRRSNKKDNWPVVEKYEVPAHKRSHFVGLGGRNLRKITAETGVTLVPLDDSTFDLFAPNKVGNFLLLAVFFRPRFPPPTLCFLSYYRPSLFSLCSLPTTMSESLFRRHSSKPKK